MASPKSKSKGTRRKSETVELVPDAWSRFERFIKQVVKAGPQHRAAKPKARRKHTERG